MIRLDVVDPNAPPSSAFESTVPDNAFAETTTEAVLPEGEHGDVDLPLETMTLDPMLEESRAFEASTPDASTRDTSLQTAANGKAATVMIDIVGHTLMLLPEKVAFLPESDTLLVADVHIGKATSFRQQGVPVPAGTTDETLGKLTKLIRGLDVKRIVFLGDFLHSSRSMSESTFASVLRWRELHSSLELTLVRGNHDDRAGDPPAVLDIQAFDEPLRHGALAFCHHPRPIAGAYVLAGHLHPCVSIGGRAHDWHRLPCFWFSQQVGVLPAFGAFTGMQTLRVKQGERVFAAAEHRVFELQPKPKDLARPTMLTHRSRSGARRG